MPRPTRRVRSRRGDSDPGALAATISASQEILPISLKTALELKVASGIDPANPATHFSIIITDDIDKSADVTHEIVTCTDVNEKADPPTMTVKRSASAHTWAAGKQFAATSRLSIRTVSLTREALDEHVILKVSVEDAYRLRQPSHSSADLLGQPFLMVLRDGSKFEWVRCLKNERSTGELRVDRHQAGTVPLKWDEDADLIAPGAGHNSLDLVANEKALAEGPPTRARVRLYERLRLYRNVYARKFNVLDKALTGNRGATPFPRVRTSLLHEGRSRYGHRR